MTVVTSNAPSTRSRRLRALSVVVGLAVVASCAGPSTTPTGMTSSIAPTMPVVVEAYDGAGSGLGVGLMIGALTALICTALIVIVGIFGATSELAIKFSDNLLLWVGGLVVITVVCGVVGLFIGKSSE